MWWRRKNSGTADFSSKTAKKLSKITPWEFFCINYSTTSFPQTQFGMQKIVSFKQAKYCQTADWGYLASEQKGVPRPWLLLNTELSSISWLGFMSSFLTQPYYTPFRTSASLASRP